jgi:hypothetical protein
MATSYTLTDYFVVRTVRNSRTGRHTYRDGPFTKEQAYTRARSAAPFAETVYVTWGTPYFVGSPEAGTAQYQRIS